jgi:hypothetical protein
VSKHHQLDCAYYVGFNVVTIIRRSSRLIYKMKVDLDIHPQLVKQP